jgi:hypothetical protein
MNALWQAYFYLKHHRVRETAAQQDTFSFSCYPSDLLGIKALLSWDFILSCSYTICFQSLMLWGEVTNSTNVLLNILHYLHVQMDKTHTNILPRDAKTDNHQNLSRRKLPQNLGLN